MPDSWTYKLRQDEPLLPSRCLTLRLLCSRRLVHRNNELGESCHCRGGGGGGGGNCTRMPSNEARPRSTIKETKRRKPLKHSDDSASAKRRRHLHLHCFPPCSPPTPLGNFHPNMKQNHIPPAVKSEILTALLRPSCVGPGEIGLHYHCATTGIRNG